MTAIALGAPANVRSQTSKLTKIQRAYLFAFAVSVIICWSPNKLLPYLAPLAMVVWVIISVPKKIFLWNTVIFGFMWIFWICISAFFNHDFIFQNAMLAILTYSSFYPIFIIPSKHLASERLLKRMAQILLFVVAIQSLIGAVQVVYGFSKTGRFDVNNGDYIEGTISLALGNQTGFETPMFATNMAFALITLMPFLLIYKKKLWILIFLFGTIILVLASVVHILLFLLVALAISFFIYKIKLSLFFRLGTSTIIIAFTFCLMLVLMVTFLPQNLSKISVHFDRVRNLSNPKSILVYRLFTSVPQEYPFFPLVGIGPGQFSSRASLIASGYYLGGIENPRPVPYLEPTVSHALEVFVLDLWRRLIGWPGSAGATMRPFSSWISSYSEFGIFGVLLVIGIFTMLLIKVKKRTKSWITRNLAFSFGTGLTLIFLLGIQENYWEIPQAIFIGCLSLQVIYANIVYQPIE